MSFCGVSIHPFFFVVHARYYGVLPVGCQGQVALYLCTAGTNRLQELSCEPFAISSTRGGLIILNGLSAI